MADLALLTLKLRPTHQDSIPAWTGRAAHAWFLDSLRGVQPELSAAVHDGDGPKPLTVSGLMPVPHGDELHLHPRQPLYLQVTTLHPDLTRITLNALVPAWISDGIMTLHDQPLRVESVDTITACYADLLAAGAETRSRSLALSFSSPTMFKKTGDLQVPLPLPEYVFGSLIERWTAFSPVALSVADLAAWVPAHVVIQGHRIRTQRLAFARGQRGTAVGFLGDVRFQALSGTRPHLGLLHTLVAFAPFSGVGAKTTVGLGRVEIVEAANEREGLA